MRCKAFLLSVSLSAVATTFYCFELTLIHTNDVHAHYEQTNKYGGRCPASEAQQGSCYGGTARLQTEVDRIRKKDKNVLFLNAGDYYQGTLYFNLQTWNITSVFMNLLGYQAMCLGNHEFDDGVEELKPLLDRVHFPVLACNLDISNEPRLAKVGCVHTFNYTDGGKTERIAVVGYITPETDTLSRPGTTVKFLDEIESLTPIVKKLTDSGFNKIIALGHSGVLRDQEIAAKVPGIDIIVGGHSHTFLYSGVPPSTEVPLGPYPIVVNRIDGSKALVVQASAFGKYLGFIKLSFSDNGDIESWNGQPILLNSSIPEDKKALEVLKPYKEQVDQQAGVIVGTTGVLLQGERLVCRMRECNLGNLLTDAMVSYYRLKNFDETKKGQLSIAVWNSGGIRASIDEQINKGNITMEDINTVAPFGNTIDVVNLTGAGVRNIMEHSVEKYDASGVDPPGGFLQVSGIHVVYDVRRPPKQRVVSLKVLCNECRVPKYLPVNDTKVYTLAIPTYLVVGGDGFSSIDEDKVGILQTGDLDTDIIVSYLSRNQPIFIPVDERVIFAANGAKMQSINSLKILFSTTLIILFLNFL